MFNKIKHSIHIIEIINNLKKLGISKKAIKKIYFDEISNAYVIEIDKIIDITNKTDYYIYTIDNLTYPTKLFNYKKLNDKDWEIINQNKKLIKSFK